MLSTDAFLYNVYDTQNIKALKNLDIRILYIFAGKLKFPSAMKSEEAFWEVHFFKKKYIFRNKWKKSENISLSTAIILQKSA